MEALRFIFDRLQNTEFAKELICKKNPMLAKITGTPYFAVIFTSKRPLNQEDGYDEMADRMVALSATQPGFLGIESWRNAEGYGVTISYWRDLQAIQQWKAHPEHLPAQARGRKEWYEQYYLRVCKVEYDHAFIPFPRDQQSPHK